MNINYFKSLGTFSWVVYQVFLGIYQCEGTLGFHKRLCLALREKLNILNCDMEFDHLGSLGSCKQVMALWIMAQGIEVVGCLLNQISVLSEESSKRNAHISNSIAKDSNRKAKH